MRAEEIREIARRMIPHTRFQPWGDSPTLRSYTDWEVLEGAFRNPTPGEASGEPLDDVPLFSFDVAEDRATAIHFSSAFFFRGGERIVSRSSSGYAAHHFVVEGPARIEEEARAPKSATFDVYVDGGDIVHVVDASAPLFSYVRLHAAPDSRVRVWIIVKGGPAHVRYRVFPGDGADVSLSGLSLPSRSDVVTDAVLSPRSSVHVRYVLLQGEAGMLVHRGVLRVGREAKWSRAVMESGFLTLGGLAVAVPQLEVLTDAVAEARHSARDLIPQEEALFYMRSRGVSPDDALRVHVESVARSVLGPLWGEERVKAWVNAFSRGLQ